jgi:hypothetical protein
MKLKKTLHNSVFVSGENIWIYMLCKNNDTKVLFSFSFFLRNLYDISAKLNIKTMFPRFNCGKLHVKGRQLDLYYQRRKSHLQFKKWWRRRAFFKYENDDIFRTLCLDPIWKQYFIDKLYQIECRKPHHSTAWSTMIESVGNETIEKYWCFSVS